MIVIVTGTPGTGKTTVAKIIARKRNLKYIDVNLMIKKFSLYDGFDEKRNCMIVDEKKLTLFLIDFIRKFKKKKKSKYLGLIIDSHMSHYLPSHYVDQCIVTKCSLPVLKSRLKKRGYSETKVRENLDAEIFDVCRIEALERGHKVRVIETDSINRSLYAP
jgi:adenylate kinase